MRLAIALARKNVESRTGGPFGAAIFECSSGRLVAGGVNLVLPMKNSMLHAEVVAIILAEHRLQSFTLGIESGTAHELVTSCEPCAMCLGAIHWSGVSSVVTGATKQDAEETRFEEGPVFPESYQYLEQRGVTITREVLREEARAVLRLYATMSGEIY
jgi:tRNA(Arg) A34 adenosine deaminase TadA